MGDELFHADGRKEGRKDGQTDMTKLIVVFCTFANAPKVGRRNSSKTEIDTILKMFRLLN